MSYLLWKVYQAIIKDTHADKRILCFYLQNQWLFDGWIKPSCSPAKRTNLQHHWFKRNPRKWSLLLLHHINMVPQKLGQESILSMIIQSLLIINTIILLRMIVWRLIIIFCLEWLLQLSTYDAWGKHAGCCSRCKLSARLSSQVFITIKAIPITLCYHPIKNQLNLFITPSILLIIPTTPQNYHLNAQIHIPPLLSPSHPLS